MSRNTVIVLILAVALGIFFVVKCSKSDSPVETTASSGNSVAKLFVEFNNGITNNDFLIFKGDPSIKPTYFNSVDDMEVSPTFHVEKEGLNYYKIASSPIYAYVFINNGDEMHFDIGVTEIKYKGSNQKLNQFLLSYTNEFETLALEILPSKAEVAKVSPEKIKSSLDELEQAHTEMLNDKGSLLTSDIKSKLQADFRETKKFLLMTFLDKKYTTKQFKTALKHINESDYKNEKLAMNNPTFAKASMLYYDLKSYSSSKMSKRSDLKIYNEYLLSEGLSPKYAERLCMEKALRGDKKLKDQALRMTSNTYLTDYVNMNSK